MNSSWSMSPIGEICDILDNRRKPITKRNRIAGDYPYYGATGVLDHVHDYLFDEPLVLVGEDGAKWGSGDQTAYMVRGKCWVNNHAHVLRPKRSIVNDEWLNYYLVHSDLAGYVTGLTVPKLNQGNLREILVPLPPVAEQKRIVSILNQSFVAIDHAKTHAEKNFQNAKELFDSYLNKMFTEKDDGWEEKKLGEALEAPPRNGWSPPAANHSATGTPVLTLSAVTGFVFKNSAVKYTSAETKSAAHYWVKKGDLLITRSNTPELVGHVAVVDNLEQPTIYPDLIMKLVVDRKLAIPRFLYFQLRTERLRGEIRASAKGANPTMKKINQKSVQALNIWVPSIDKQKTIVRSLDAVENETNRLFGNYSKKNELLDTMKDSLLHRAFQGEL